MSHVLKFVATLAGCSVAVALAIGVPISAGGMQAAIPTAESRSLLDQHVVLVRAPHHERRPAGPVVALVGEGWG